MAAEQPFKDRKRSSDITGRGPSRTTIKGIMHQGTGTTAASADNLRALMKQGSTSKVASPLMLKKLMKQG